MTLLFVARKSYSCEQITILAYSGCLKDFAYLLYRFLCRQVEPFLPGPPVAALVLELIMDNALHMTLLWEYRYYLHEEVLAGLQIAGAPLGIVAAPDLDGCSVALVAHAIEMVDLLAFAFLLEGAEGTGHVAL